jgi:hypothetical protein
MVHMGKQTAGHPKPEAFIFLVCLLAAIFASTVRAQSLQVIDLHYRTAQDVIPVLQPLLAPGDALTGNDYKLFVRASPATLKQVRSVLEQLDRKPRQLLVSVRRASKGTVEREAAAANVELGTRDSRGSVVATEDSASREGGDVASVQVIEGNSALISTGQSVPLITAAAGGGRRPWAASSTSYRDISSGFMVTPRISGETVTLDIEQRNQQAGANSSVQTQSLSTQIQGSLNQWISLGGVRESSNSQDSGILNRQYSTRSDATTIWVKVEEL